MDKNKELASNELELFEKYGEEITPAYERAVREALRKHKQAGVPSAVSVEGRVVLIQPDQIEIPED